MMKKMCLSVVIWMALTGLCVAQSFDFQLHAGSKSLAVEAQYRKELVRGYAKVGIVGVYTDDDDTQYNWGGGRLAVGNDTLVPGLTCEVGVVALYGDAEKGHHEGDIGALAFDITGKYLFPERVLPIPLEVFSSIRYAPDLLSFRDTESYKEFNLGVGVQLIENASVSLIYTKYLVDFDDLPWSWELDEDVIRGGIVLHF